MAHDQIADTSDENMIMEIVEQKMRRAGNLAVAPRRDATKTLAFCGRGKPPSYMPEQIEFYANAILQALLLGLGEARPRQRHRKGCRRREQARPGDRSRLGPGSASIIFRVQPY